MTIGEIKNFLEIPYDQLEELNLEAKQKVVDKTSEDELREFYLKYLHEEKQLKAVTICFSDIEGRFHMLDYDKKFLIKSYDNLTFDGSSVRGFSDVRESDLRLTVDWGSFRWLPSDVFGPGKVSVFGLINDKDGNSYPSDMRSQLKHYSDTLYKKDRTTLNVSVECEGFLFDGLNAEQTYNSREGFKLVSSGGYYNSLPKDRLKMFIDSFAEAQRAMAFENEKDHPEVAPSQFELNYSYCDAVLAADQVQLYKLLARQIAANMNCTASFLPKPIAGINGSGMHCNVSVSQKGKNLFYDPNGEDYLSKYAWEFVDRILNNGKEICLALNPSVNAYRRLDPDFEAPNQLKSSAVDRTAMVRIPIGNEKTSRVEVRTVAPDANPYLVMLGIFRTGLEGPMSEKFSSDSRKNRAEYLPSNIYEAMELFNGSAWVSEMMGAASAQKFAHRKVASANRCPRDLGAIVKTSEIIFHHEITNQYLWGRF